ncbi:MAG: MBL fold metallo-hydrolase [Acidocella sp.]|nr:MBL fold metallo-hydrolase [Acidocella sp.]
MKYPRSDHCDGKTFFNPEPTMRNAKGRRMGFMTIIRARMKKDPAVWANWPAFVANRDYPALAAPSVCFIGHSSFLIRLPGLNILTDPVFSKRCSPVRFAGPSRVRAPGMRMEDLPPVEMILLSHNHYDHMDISALKRLRRLHPKAVIVTMLGNAAFLAKKGLTGAIELDWWDETQVGETMVTATPARHFAARGLYDRNETLWGGMMIMHQGRRLYFAGDTGYTRFFKEIRERLGAPDFALLPIGAYEPRWFMGPVHMNPADAVQAFQDLGARRAVGMHFGVFQLTAESIDAPLHDLQAARAASGVAAAAFFSLDVGESAALW